MLAEFLIASESVEVDGVEVSAAVEGPSKRFVKGLIASMFCVNLSSTSSDSRMSLSSASASVSSVEVLGSKLPENSAFG